MTAQVLDGASAAAAIRAEVARAAADFTRRTGMTPLIATVMGGDDPASLSYVRAIKRAAERAGLAHRHVALAPGLDDAGLRGVVQGLNADPSVHGVLVQFPLPPGLSQASVTGVLDPAKDVDGITAASAGRLLLGQDGFVPSTPLGGLELLRHHGIAVTGLHATIVGRSAIVGKPLALLLLREHATVTICHTRTRDLAGECRRADLLCAATGRSGLITGEMVKPGAVVLDFGTSPGPDGKLAGDVDFPAAQQVAAWISPVPGGTGAMTTAVLLRHTLRAGQRLGGAERVA